MARRINKGYRRMSQVGDRLYRARMWNKVTGETWTEGTYTTPKATRAIIGLRKAKNLDPATGETVIDGKVEWTRTSWKPLEEK